MSWLDSFFIGETGPTGPRGAAGVFPGSLTPCQPVAAGQTKDATILVAGATPVPIVAVGFMPLSDVAADPTDKITVSLQLFDIAVGTLTPLDTFGSDSFTFSARIQAGTFAIANPYTVPAGSALLGRAVSSGTGALTAGGTWIVYGA